MNDGKALGIGNLVGFDDGWLDGILVGTLVGVKLGLVVGFSKI